MYSVMRCFVFSVLAMVALVLIQGCTTTSPASLIKLARISPMEADPSQIRFGVITPEYLQVATGDVIVSLDYVSKNGRWKVAQQFLPIVQPQAGSKAMAAYVKMAEQAWSARLSDEDARRFEQMQNKIRQDRETNGGGKGSLGIGITACSTRPLPEGAIPVSTFLKTVETSDYFPLQQRVDLRRTLQKASGGSAAPLDHLRRCSAA